MCIIGKRRKLKFEHFDACCEAFKITKQLWILSLSLIRSFKRKSHQSLTGIELPLWWKRSFVQHLCLQRLRNVTKQWLSSSYGKWVGYGFWGKLRLLWDLPGWLIWTGGWAVPDVSRATMRWASKSREVIKFTICRWKSVGFAAGSHKPVCMRTWCKAFSCNFGSRAALRTNFEFWRNLWLWYQVWSTVLKLYAVLRFSSNDINYRGRISELEKMSHHEIINITSLELPCLVQLQLKLSEAARRPTTIFMLWHGTNMHKLVSLWKQLMLSVVSFWSCSSE